MLRSDLQVGGLTTAILLDSDDHHMKQRLRSRRDKSGREDDSALAVTNRLTYYKHHTLPIIGYLDNVQQLVVVSGQPSGRSHGVVLLLALSYCYWH